MKNLNIFLASIFILFLCSDCSKIKKTDAEYEREAWIESFSDSIGIYQLKTQEIENKLAKENEKISGLLQDFEKVENPREVSGYYLLKGWQSRLPFTTTGIYARINENEKLELIATLAGGTFNQIGVRDGGEDYVSNVVPNDQAFNYRHARFNTVYFQSGKADTIADFIARHAGERINLRFIEGNREKTFPIPENGKNMIEKTYKLYSAQIEARNLQRELFICSRKIDAFRRLQDTQNPNN